jgi:nucleoside-diphosphate-sugar epimerase
MKHRIFITGATGYLGSAVAARMARAGHDVYGLTRTTEHEAMLAGLGVKPVVGDLSDAEPWIGLLQNCDVVAHCAFDAQTGASDQDHHALEAFRVAALDGRVRRVLYTSTPWVHGKGGDKPVDESSPLKPLEIAQWRIAHEEIAIDLSAHDVSTLVMRPAMLYGEARGVMGGWFAEAQRQQVITYPGDGSQRWAMVHRDDAADAYLLALEHGEAGDRFLLSDESRHTVRELAEAAAAAAGVPAKERPADEVVAALGVYGKALLNDQLVSSAKARRELGWVPRHASFVAEAPQLWREWLESHVEKVA